MALTTVTSPSIVEHRIEDLDDLVGEYGGGGEIFPVRHPNRCHAPTTRGVPSHRRQTSSTADSSARPPADSATTGRHRHRHRPWTRRRIVRLAAGATAREESTSPQSLDVAAAATRVGLLDIAETRPPGHHKQARAADGRETFGNLAGRSTTSTLKATAATTTAPKAADIENTVTSPRRMGHSSQQHGSTSPSPKRTTEYSFSRRVPRLRDCRERSQAVAAARLANDIDRWLQKTARGQRGCPRCTPAC